MIRNPLLRCRPRGAASWYTALGPATALGPMAWDPMALHSRQSPVRRFTALASRNEAAKRPASADRDERVHALLSSAKPLDAFALVAEYKDAGQLIPPGVMTRLYEALQRAANPLLTHLFAGFTSVDQVGAQQFVVNAERVIKLYIAQRDWESCIAYIREVELANSGEVVLSYETLEAVLLSAKWFNDTEICMQILQVMTEAYPSVYARTWGLVTQVALDTRDYECLKWVYRKALVPGHLVLDDASYLRMASIASQNGDLHVCEWASLRMRRRQRALGTGDTNSLQLYIYLIEAAARSSIIHADDRLAASFQAVCRYLVRLGPLAGHVSVHDLPQTVDALVQSAANSEMLGNMFANMKEDPSVCSEAKVMVFNLLLYADLAADKPADAVLERAYSFRQAGAEFNEDSILCLIELAHRGDAGVEAVQALVKQCPTHRVLKRAKMLTQNV